MLKTANIGGPMTEKQDLRKALEVASVGIEMGISVGIGYFMGHYLDLWLDTSPYLVVFFTVAGIWAAFKALWRTAGRFWPKD